MIPDLHLATVFPADGAGRLAAFAEHYRRLGVARFHVVGHAVEERPDQWRKLDEQAGMAGLSIERKVIEPWHEDLNMRLYRDTMRTHPRAWFVVADYDELHLWDRPIADAVSCCEEHGYDFVCGCFLDRVAPGGRLVDVPDGCADLFVRFPLAGQFAAVELGALPCKVVLARGGVRLHLGQHRAETGRGCPPSQIYAQVHHFKWTSTCVERLQIRANCYRSNAWRLTYPQTLAEAERFLAYVQAHEGVIDAKDPRFLFAASGEFDEYPFWNAVSAFASAWEAHLAGGYGERLGEFGRSGDTR